MVDTGFNRGACQNNRHLASALCLNPTVARVELFRFSAYLSNSLASARRGQSRISKLGLVLGTVLVACSYTLALRLGLSSRRMIMVSRS